MKTLVVPKITPSIKNILLQLDAITEQEPLGGDARLPWDEYPEHKQELINETLYLLQVDFWMEVDYV